MRGVLKIIGHAVLGGAAAGLTLYTGGGASISTLALTAAASALTSAVSLLSRSPLDEQPRK